MVKKAMHFAKKAHEGQLRKFTNEPYIVHPIAVAGIVYSVTSNTDMLCAAVLHDVVEDTDCTIEQIEKSFGSTIASLVADLTDVSKPSDGNRKVRKHLDLLHNGQGSAQAKTIKLADLIDNTKSIVSFDPNFARKYMDEKQALLKVLKEGDSILLAIAQGLVDRYYETRTVK